MSELKPFFAKEVDTADRKAMIDFLTNHFRYDTMNSWNASTSYANNVKVYNLGIEDKDILDKAWNIVCSDIECEEMYDSFRQIIDEFRQNEGYDIGFNGRSGGYLVLYKMKYDNAKNSMSVYPGISIDQYEDFSDEDSWTMSDLKERCELVCAFDHACDLIRQEFLFWCTHGDIIEEEYAVIKKTRYITLPEEE